MNNHKEVSHIGRRNKMNQMEVTRICTILVIIGFILTIGFSINSEVASASDGKGSWTTKLPMPTARSSLGVISCNDEIYAIGGFKLGSGYLDIVEAYDPQTNTWNLKTPMPIENAAFGIASHGDKIFIIGGENDNGNHNKVLVYDTLTNSWNYKTSMPTPRTQLTAATVGNKIYAIGGGYSRYSAGYDTVEIYDIFTDSWTTGPLMPTPRRALACGVINDIIYVIGGHIVSPGTLEGFPTVEAFDTITNTWDTSIAQLPIPNGYMDAGVVQDKLYVIGGFYYLNKPTYTVDKIIQYDPNTNVWTYMTNIPTPRAGLGVAEASEKLYAIGGMIPNSEYYMGSSDNIYVTTNEEFTPPLTQTNEKPTVSITSPSNNAELSDTVNILGTASDSDGTIQSVQIRIDSGSWITVSGTTSWSYNWDTTTVINGGHTIYARSYDGTDYSDLTSIDVTVNNPYSENLKPSISISFPLEGDTINGTIAVSGAAFDSDGTVQSVEIKIDSGSWITASGTTSWTYNWDTTNFEDGSHVVSARSYDGEDYSQTETVIVSVQNDQETGDETPGFELIIALAAIALLLLWRKHEKK